MSSLGKYLCFVLMFATVYAQDNSNQEVTISEAQAFLLATQVNSAIANEDKVDSTLSPQKRFEENPKHNVHEYDYKQQVIVGGSVMFCIALSLIVNNNYNPKREKK